MKTKGYKLGRIPNFCTICPNDYWHQVQECCEVRYRRDSKKRQ